MALKQFLPFLTDDQGRSLVKENGVVVTKSIPEWLPEAPEKWEENVIEYTRDDEFHGIMRSYITNLKFVLDGAFIIRDFFYRLGADIVMFFIWLKLDQNFGGNLAHKSWYKGELDFTSFQDVDDGVEIHVREGGFHKELQANKNIAYTYKFASDDDTVSLEFDGMEIFEKANYQDVDGVEFSPVNLGGGADRGLTPTAFIGNEGFSRGILFQDQTMAAYATFADTISQSNCLLQNNFQTAITFNLKGRTEIIGINQTSPAWAVRVRFLKTSSTIPTQNDYQVFSQGFAPGETKGADFDINITLQPGERLYKQAVFFGGVSGNPSFVFTENSKFSVSFFTLKPLTVHDAFRAFDLANKLTKSMSNNVSSLTGDILSNDHNLLVLSGDSIRGFADAELKTKFADCFKSLDAVRCLSMNIVNNNPVISSRYDSYNNGSLIASLGECKNYRGSVANNLRYGSVISGYPSRDMDNVNGRFSFCSPYSWKTPIISDAVYDCMSVYLADPFIMEITRISNDGKTTTDSKTDNDVFFADCEKVYSNDFTGDVEILNTGYIRLKNIVGLALKVGTRIRITNGNNLGTYKVSTAIEDAGDTVIFVYDQLVTENINTTVEFRHYKLRRLVYTDITGVPSKTTVFNVELSPKRNLATHYRWIKSACWKNENGYLKFQTTEKNILFSTEDAGGTIIKEVDNILISTMGDSVFIPYIFTFEVESPNNLRDLMTGNSGGRMDFTNLDFPYKGYPINIKTNEATLETQEYTLLATADNNLFNLTKNR